MISATLCAIISPAPVVQVLPLAGVLTHAVQLSLVLSELVNEPATGVTNIALTRLPLAQNLLHTPRRSEAEPR